MTELTTEQLIYLLHAHAYTEAGTVTKGTVKACLSREWKEKAEELYAYLQDKKLIEQTTRTGRLSVTKLGLEALISNLSTTDYKFNSAKGPKVLNALLDCVGEAAKSRPQLEIFEEMTFDEFQEKFKEIYFEERRIQEIRGAVAIYSQKLLQKFSEKNSIPQDRLNKYFDLLKTDRKIFTVIEKDYELMEWAE